MSRKPSIRTNSYSYEPYIPRSYLSLLLFLLIIPTIFVFVFSL